MDAALFEGGEDIVAGITSREYPEERPIGRSYRLLAVRRARSRREA